MPEENGVIPTSRLARWMMLALLLGGGIAFYFRDGLHLPAFGSVEPPAESDTAR
jgi:hypothetical protein